jgi:hypothetical protein
MRALVGLVDGISCAKNRVEVEVRKKCKGLKKRKVCARVKISLVACKISKTKREEVNVPGSTTDLGQSELDTPDLTLVTETVLADGLQLRVPIAGC